MAHVARLLKRLQHTAGRLRHVEWIPLVVLLAVALAVWTFLELADEIGEGDLAGFDRQVLTALRRPADVNDPLGPPWLEEFMRDVTALGSVGILSMVTIAACGFLWLQGKRLAVLYVLTAVLGALVITSTLKIAYDRPRPDLFPHGAQVYSASFPSGHSAMSAAAYLTLGALLARYQKSKWLQAYLVAVAILLTLAVGFSRVYLSVHWPTDVLAGWTVGAAWALLCWGIAPFLESRGYIERRPTG